MGWKLTFELQKEYCNLTEKGSDLDEGRLGGSGGISWCMATIDASHDSSSVMSVRR